MIGSNNYLGPDDPPQGQGSGDRGHPQVRHELHRLPLPQRHPPHAHRARGARWPSSSARRRPWSSAPGSRSTWAPSRPSWKPQRRPDHRQGSPRQHHRRRPPWPRSRRSPDRAVSSTTTPPTSRTSSKACRRTPGKLVIVDGVFSMGGDIARLPEIVPICKKYGARLMVDDAHSLGVLGGGRGTAPHFGMDGDVDLVMGTFSKSFASVGGFIAGPKEVIHWIQIFSRPFIFSASLPAGQCRHRPGLPGRHRAGARAGRAGQAIGERVRPGARGAWATTSAERDAHHPDRSSAT